MARTIRYGPDSEPIRLLSAYSASHSSSGSRFRAYPRKSPQSDFGSAPCSEHQAVKSEACEDSTKRPRSSIQQEKSYSWEQVLRRTRLEMNRSLSQTWKTPSRRFCNSARSG